MSSADFMLDTRPGWPPELQFLLDRYPRPVWPTHANLGATARFWLENLRIDPAHDLGGLRVNAWVSLLLFGFGIGWFIWLGRHAAPQRRPGHSPAAADVIA